MFKLTASKNGMTYRTPYDDQTTKEGVQDAIETMILRGFTYITIQVLSDCDCGSTIAYLHDRTCATRRALANAV